MGDRFKRPPAPDTLAPGLDAPTLARLAQLPVTGMLRSGPGRETFLWESPAGEPRVVKRYQGQSWREVLHERVQGLGPRKPARREYEALLALSGAGVPVPAALGYYEQDSISMVIMERLDPLISLRDLLESQPGRAEEFLEPVLELVTRFHGAGWYHRDLYLDHLVLAGAGEILTLIDLERARQDRSPRRRWFIKDLAALWFSTPDAVPARLGLRFLATWLDRHGVNDRGTRRRWLKAIQAKAARMAAHVPRGGTSFSPTRP